MKNISPFILSVGAGVLVTALLAQPASADAGRYEVALSACPPAVQASILDHARGGEIDEIDFTQIEDRTLYVAEVDLPGKRELELYVAGDGRILRIEEEIAWSDLPAPVQETLWQQAKHTGRIDDWARTTVGKTVTYAAEIEREGQPDIELELAADGTLLAAVEERGR